MAAAERETVEVLQVIFQRKRAFNERFLLRHEFKDILEIIAYDSSSKSSSKDKDINFLFYHLAFPPKPPHQVHISLDDFSKLECKELFRLSGRLCILMAVPSFCITILKCV